MSPLRRALCLLLLTALTAFAGPSRAAEPAPAAIGFEDIDGGTIRLADLRDGPVLIVNTASMCGYVGQFDALQALHDRYAARGLTVIAVPSDDFGQELADAQAVKEFCAVNFDLTLRMTTITHVKGDAAHPFYRWLAEAHGFRPSWNFNKVLLAPGGALVATWGAGAAPDSAAVTDRIEALLR